MHRHTDRHTLRLLCKITFLKLTKLVILDSRCGYVREEDNIYLFEDEGHAR